MDEMHRNPQEDISYIRSILEKTTADMKTLSPWFARFGIVWLVYGLLTAALMLIGRFASMALQIPLSGVNAVSGWAFYVILAVGFFEIRHKQKARGLGAEALKLVDMWGACILLFLALTIGLEVVIPFVAVRVLAFSAETTNQLGMACSICQSCLLFVLPILPLLITAIFLENRRMLWAGIVLVALAVLIVGSHILLIWTEARILPAAIRGWNAAVCLLDIAPGIMLLLFGRALKRA